MSIDSLRADVKSAIRRIEKFPVADVSHELKENVYPLLDSIVAELAEQSAALEEVAAAVDFEGSYIEKPLGVLILTALGVGEALAGELSKIAEVSSDELLKKKLLSTVADWTKISTAVAEQVGEAMSEDEDADEPEDEDADDDSEEGEDE